MLFKEKYVNIRFFPLNQVKPLLDTGWLIVEQGHLNAKMIRFTSKTYEEIVEEQIRSLFSMNEEIKLTNLGIQDKTDIKYLDYRTKVDRIKEEAKVFCDERDEDIALYSQNVFKESKGDY